MAVGLYISGLEHATDNETVEKYAARYVKELENATFDYLYYTKIEKVYYHNEKSSLIIKIFEMILWLQIWVVSYLIRD